MTLSGLPPSPHHPELPTSRLRRGERGAWRPDAPLSRVVTGAPGGLGRGAVPFSSRRNQGEAKLPCDFRARMLVRFDRGKYPVPLNDGFFFFF